MFRDVLAVILMLVSFVSAQSKAPVRPAAKSAEETVKKLEQQWLDAIGKRDQSAVDVLLAPDFQATGIDGKNRDRQVELATVVDTTRPVLSRFFGRLDVAVYGPSVAITRGLVVIDGPNIREAHIAFIHIWILRAGKWKVVASQETMENG